MKQIFSSKIVFFLIATAVILALNLTPTILDVRHSPPGRTFTMLHNNTQDYYFYQALMNEGANGANFTYDPYTSEPHQPSIIFSYFLWLGKLSKLFNISYALTYLLSRIILGFLFLLAVYCLILFLKIPYPNITYLFFLFAAPFMHTINDYGVLRSVPFMSWWNGVDPIRRAAFLPHHMFGGLILVMSVMLIFKFINKPQRKYLFLLILMSFAMAFVHTPSLLIMLLILPPALVAYLVINTLGASRNSNHQAPKTKQVPNHKYQIPNVLNFGHYKLFGNWKLEIGFSQFTGLLGYWITGLLVLLFMVSQTKNGFPWSQYIDWEKNLQFPLEKELIGALGILFPFSLVGIFNAIRSKKFENIFFACWLIVPFIFIPLAPKLNLSNIRLIQGVPYLPLSILAILGIDSIKNIVISFHSHQAPKYKHQDPNKSQMPSTKMQKFRIWNFDILNLFGFWNLEFGVLTVIVILFSIFTYPTLKWSLTDQIREYWPIYGNVYLDDRLYSAFEFINQNYPAKTITLATFYAGNYLPAYTNTISFIGHFGYTYNEVEKEKKTQLFFHDQMSPEEAKNFLLSNKIALVFQGPEEKPLSKNNYLYPNILKPVYDKEEATIYKPNF